MQKQVYRYCRISLLIWTERYISSRQIIGDKLFLVNLMAFLDKPSCLSGDDRVLRTHEGEVYYTENVKHHHIDLVYLLILQQDILYYFCVSHQ